MTQPWLILDFDSTVVQVESLDELARIALIGASDRTDRTRQIEALTTAGMNGEIGFGEALARRLELFAAGREHIAATVELLKRSVDPSFVTELPRLRRLSAEIYVVSGGFGDCLEPVLAHYGFNPTHILANRFEFDKSGRIIGADQANLLAHDSGKVAAIKGLGLDGPIIMVGDGMSDWQVKAQGAADEFVAYIGTVERSAVTSKAVYVAHNFGELAQMMVQFVR